MKRGIGIIDTSNKTDSPHRSESLFKRLEAERPDVFPKPSELTWEIDFCTPSGISKDISSFWLLWVHDTYGSIDFEKTIKAAVSQEKRFRGGLPTIIVCYGGGASRFPYPPSNASVEELAVDARMIRTGDSDLMVSDFFSAPANGWNLDGFLLAAAENYPDVDKSLLLDLLCNGMSAAEISAASIAHATLPIVRLLNGEMLRALDGSPAARLRFSSKIPVFMRALDDVINRSAAATAEDGLEDIFNEVKTDLIKVKNLIEKLQKLPDWSGLNKKKYENTLETLRFNCEIIRHSIFDPY